MAASRFAISTLALLMVLVTPVMGASKKSEDIAALEQRIAALEQKIEEQQAAYERLLAERFDALSKQLDGKFASLEQKIAQGGNPAAGQDSEAGVLLGQVNQLMAAGNIEQAKQKMNELQTRYGSTNTARRAARMQQELEVFGKDAPQDFGIEQWYQGDSGLDGDGTTLLIFWEVWCPHCKREVPKLEQIYEKYAPKGLKVVGLTRLTRSATDQGVRDFIKEHSVSYPIAKENGSASSYFNVGGIPAAAVIKDGKVVWRGHPARLTEQMLEGWL